MSDNPSLGRWLSGNGSTSVTVNEVVFAPTDEFFPDNGFFLVWVADEGDPCGALELDPSEWEAMVAERSLTAA